MTNYFTKVANPKFSIITPVFYNKEDKDNERQPRYEMFLRCINSVFSQTYTEPFEWIIGDDICTPTVEEVIKSVEWKKPSNVNIQVIRMKEKTGRIGASNECKKEATGEWICELDADDEYASVYLEAIDKASQTYPDYKMFSFNHLMFGYDFSTWVRDFMDMEEQKDEPFRSGRIGLGAYVYKKEIMDKIEPLPVCGLWDLAEWFFERYPEVKELYKNNHNGQYDSLGNPWGNDYAIFYMLTRKNKCKKLNTALYYVHSHWGHRWAEEEPGKLPQHNPNLV